VVRRQFLSIMFRNFKHIKFVVLAKPRSGSTWLQKILESQKQIKMYGEIFNFTNISPKQLNRPVKFLQEDIFKQHPAPIRAVGFKLLYDQDNPEKAFRFSIPQYDPVPFTDSPEFLRELEQRWMRMKDANALQNIKQVRPYLQNHTEIRIIHLKRKNILRGHLSFCSATRGLWIQKKQDWPIYLDYEGCLKAFNGTKEYEALYDEIFRDHPKLNVVYEDLCKNLQEQVNHIRKFIGLKHLSIRSMAVKWEKKLSEVILNYGDLEKKFKGSCWEEFFKE